MTSFVIAMGLGLFKRPRKLSWTVGIRFASVKTQGFGLMFEMRTVSFTLFILSKERHLKSIRLLRLSSIERIWRSNVSVHF